MAAPPNGPAKPAYFSIATGSTAGTYFPVGSMVATILSHPTGSVRCEIKTACGPEGLIAVAVASPGSVANLRDVAQGRVDSAFAQANIAAWAYHGTESFKADGPYTDLRAIARLYPEAVHLVVARGAGIRSVSDLKHRRVSIDVEGSGTYVEALRILRAENLSKKSVDLVQANADRSANLLAAKQIDAFFFVGGTPAEAVLGLASEGVADLVPITGPSVKALTAGASYFTKAVIPAGTYPGIGRIETVSVGALWIVNASASEDLIYQLTSALWDASNRGFFLRGHAQAQNMSLEHALDGITIPLHPGAERFYREKGLIVPSRASAKEASAREAAAAKTR